MVLRSNPVEFLLGKGIYFCLYMLPDVGRGYEGAWRVNWCGRACWTTQMSPAIESVGGDRCGSGWLLMVACGLWPPRANPAPRHFHPSRYFWAGTGLCHQPGCHGTGEQLPGVAGVGRGKRLSPGQEEDRRQCPGSSTPLPPQGILQSCTVHVSIQNRLPHFCTFAFLSLVFSLRDFRARRPSLLPAPLLPIAETTITTPQTRCWPQCLGLGMCFWEVLFPG